MNAIAIAEPVEPATRVVPITEAVELNPRPDRGALPDDLEVSFVPMAAVEAGTGRMDPSEVRLFGAVKKGYTVFREGDVLFAKITPCMENGKMAVARGLRNGVGCGSSEFHVLRPRPGVDPHYLYQFVSSAQFRSEAAHHMTGAVGQKRVPAAFLEDREIPLPSLHRQRRIVADIEKQFSRLDEAVANLERVNAGLKRYRAAVLSAAVTGRLIDSSAVAADDRDSTQEGGAELLDRILRARRLQWSSRGRCPDPVAPDTSVLPLLPTGWVWASADQLSDFITKGTTPAPTLLSEGVGEIQFLKVYNLTFDGTLNRLQKPAFVTRQTHMSELARSRVRPGDLLINIVGPPLGQVSVVPDELPEANINQAIARIRPIAPLSSRYMALCLMADSIIGWAIRRAKTTVGQANLTLELCRALPIPLPPLAEQNLIVAEVDRRLSIVREVEVEVVSNLKRAQTLRQAVLASAFASASEAVPSSA